MPDEEQGTQALPSPRPPPPALQASRHPSASPTRYAGSSGSWEGGGSFLTLSPNGIEYRVTEERGALDSWHSYFLALLKVAGPGALVAVGYFDPGNWATDLSGGSQFGYRLLFVVLFSSIMAMYLQYLCIKLGAIRGLDLAEASRHYFHPVPNAILYLLAELSICATDLAEVIGSAIAINLLTGLSLTWGVAITGLDVFFILLFWRAKEMRVFEVAIGIVVLVIGVCFLILVIRVAPAWGDALGGYLPSAELLRPNILYIGLGIMGATVMPHNLYLHSNIVMYKINPQRMGERELEGLSSATGAGSGSGLEPGEARPLTVSSPAEHCTSPTPTSGSRDKRHHRSPQRQGCMPEAEELENLEAGAPLDQHHPQVLYSTIRTILRQVNLANMDSMLSLGFALLINSAILIVAAAAFHERGLTEVADLKDAFDLLRIWIGFPSAVLFAVALLLSGQSSTITGTMAGQIVMQGFMGDMIRLAPWLRRLLTRLLVIVPAMLVVIYYGDAGINNLLIFSQVILSIQLPFALWPLIYFTSNREIMTVTVAEEIVDDMALGSYHQLLDTDSRQTTTSTKQVCFANSPLSIVVGVGVASLLTGLNVLLLVQVILGT